MMWLAILLLVAVVAYIATRRPKREKLAALPERFVVFDLETTGLDSTKHEIIEIGAIRVKRGSTTHDTFQALVKPLQNVPKKITELTGITQEMLIADGDPIAKALREFLDFAGNLPLVSFNAEFDMGFLTSAAQQSGIALSNRAACALVMARRAWRGRKSYRLADLAKDGNLGTEGSHRALADCQRTLIVYAAAVAKLGVSS